MFVCMCLFCQEPGGCTSRCIGSIDKSYQAYIVDIDIAVQICDITTFQAHHFSVTIITNILNIITLQHYNVSLANLLIITSETIFLIF